jgi:hypothetical protein
MAILHRKSLFVDFHNPEFLKEAFSRFDAEGYIEQIKAFDPKMVMFWANDHYGNCFYNTRIGHKHERLKADYFGELAGEARRQGMAVFAYFVVGWHNYAVLTHPDWEQIDADGMPFSPFPNFHWRWACFNSPHRDDCIAQMKEIVESYGIDGIWIDILLIIPGGCYCHYCQDKYRQTFGEEMPSNPPPGTPSAKNIVEFQYLTRYDFLVDAKSALKAIKPDLIVTYNCSGDTWLSDVESDGLMDKLSQERSLWKARWAKTQGKPFEFLVTRGNYNWSDWTIKPKHRLEVEISTILANGGGVVFGDHGSPNGTLEPAVYSTLQGVMNRMDEKIPWVEGARPVADIAVLHSVKNHRMKQWLSRDGSYLLSEANGAYQILVEAKKQFEIISEKGLEDLGRYSTLIVPNQGFLAKKEARLISEFVQTGGNLLATYQTGLFGEDGRLRKDFALADVIGTHYEGVSSFSVDYIDGIETSLLADIPPIPLLVSPYRLPMRDDAKKEMGASLLTALGEGVSLASITHPSCERSATHWVSHGHANPWMKTDHPAFVSHSFGKGKSFYVALPVFRAYYCTRYQYLSRIVSRILDFMGGEESLRVRAPLGVEVVATRREEQWILHFVNLPHAELGKELKQVQEIVPVYDLRVNLREPRARRVFLPLSGERELPFTEQEGRVYFSVPELRIHQIVVIDVK